MGKKRKQLKNSKENCNQNETENWIQKELKSRWTLGLADGLNSNFFLLIKKKVHLLIMDIIKLTIILYKHMRKKVMIVFYGELIITQARNSSY